MKKYIAPEMESVVFVAKDIITNSGGPGVDVPLDPAADDDNDHNSMV